MLSRRSISSIACAAALAATALNGTPAWAETYPSKPIRIVVPFVPGGPVDVMARVLSERLAKTMDVPDIVENRAGAGGNVGAASVAKAPPDGYTLLLTPGSILTINEVLYPKLGFDPAKDFAPISLVGDMPLIVTVNASLPIASMSGFVAANKDKKDAIFMSSPGTGTTPHLAIELLKREARMRVDHVPFKGGAESATAILSGQVTGGIETPPAVLAQIQAGKLRALAVTGPQRIAALPDVPTTAQAGFPTVAITAWFGLVAPAGTPPDVVARLNREVNAALNDPGLQSRFDKFAIKPVGGTSAAFVKLAADERPKWRKLVAEANIKIE